MRFLALLLTFAFCVVAPSGFAQEAARVRASDNDGYSRIVFDWGRAVSYSLKQLEDRAVIHFNQGAVSAADIAAARATNLSSVKVISTSPPEIEIAFPKGAKLRDFAAGGRVMIDIYDPPGAPKPTKKLPAPPVVAQKKNDEKSKQSVMHAAAPAKEKPPAKPEKIKQDKILAQAPPAPKAEVKPVVGADIPPPVVQQPAKPEQPPQSNLVTISSINAAGLAVFKHGGKIYIANDSTDALVMPAVSGPDSKALLPLETKEYGEFRLFSLNDLGGAHVRGQGGNLLWRIIVPSGPARAPPVEPVRTQGKGGSKVVWPMKQPRHVFTATDAQTGKTFYLVTVTDAKDYGGGRREFVEFAALESPVGLAILSKVDDLQVKIVEGAVEISRPGGLTLASESELKALAKNSKKMNPAEAQSSVKRVFDLNNWQLGGVEALDYNRNIIMSDLGAKQGGARVEGILTLGKMYLSNGLWAEAKGFLDLAAIEMPEINQNPAYSALQGAAMALGYQSEAAFEKLSLDELKIFPEIGYWRAFALADLGDWQQADMALPEDLYILSLYPAQVRTKLSLTLAEVALRSGHSAKGEKILQFVEENKDQLTVSQSSALDYLKGEAERQKNKADETTKLWKPLTFGKDPLYRAKAGLALTRLMVEKKQLKPEKAIDNLERLRYSWRGDDLEAQIAYWLGKTYFEGSDYVKGLTIMREAASYAQGTDIGERIVTEMMEVFTRLFTGPELDKVSVLDAAALHEEYSEYLKPGPQTDKITERLAERLVKADLLDKASDLLQNEISSQQDMPEAYRLLVRLAAIYLLDDQPGKANSALDRAAALYGNLPEELKTPDRAVEIPLMRARAMSEQNRPDQALALLKALPRGADINKLRADIAWQAAYWDDAAEALQDVILDRDISLTRPLSSENAVLLLQRAVALNLANNRVALGAMREKYSGAMAQTDKAKIFDVITRPRQSAALADRETLKGVVAEVDLFKDFLNGYKSDGTKEAKAETSPVEKPAEAH